MCMFYQFSDKNLSSTAMTLEKLNLIDFAVRQRIRDNMILKSGLISSIIHICIQQKELISIWYLMVNYTHHDNWERRECNNTLTE